MSAKTVLRAAVAAVLLYGAAGARAEAVRGDINNTMSGWGTNWMATGAAFTGDTNWSVTLTATQTLPSAGFKFDQNGDWDPQWGFSAPYSTNATVNGTIGQVCIKTNADPGNLTYGQTNGMKYTFRLQGDATWWYRLYTVQATTNDPVTISSVVDNSAVAVTNTVTVTATLSAATSGEGVYVRYTTNNYTNIALLTGSVAGTTATIAIPAQPTGRTVKYYVLTSTMPAGRILDDADLCTLRANNATGGTNYAYVVGTPDPVFGNCWHFPTNGVPWASDTMRIPTNPTPGNDTYIYVGNYQTDADMTGGAVVWRVNTGSWTTNALAYVTNSGSDNYWSALIASNAVALGETLHYYIQVNYSNGGADTTYLGTTTQADNVKYAAATNAASNAFAAVSVANLGNAWHVPANAEPTGAYMRNPRHPYASNTVTIYNGNQFAGSGTTGNQSGGTLYYRLQGAGGWSSAALAFDSESGNNKYWAAAIPAGTFGKTQTVEYVLAIAYTDRDTTFLGTTNQTSTAKYAALASAQSNAYSFTYGGDPGTEPGYVWHGGNVVKVASNTVQIWAKIGYEDTNGYQWADHAEVRYRITTNGVSKRRVQGVSKLAPGKLVTASDLVLTNAMAFSHTEADTSENGNAMWWVTTVQDGELTNLESLVQYQVAAWKSATNGGNDVVRLAEYQSDGVSGQFFEYRMYSGGSGALTVNGQNADYTTTKFFIDEAASETATIAVSYTPPALSSNVEVFCNVDRRDRVDADWNSDSIPDGIQPPDGNLITTNDTTAYFAAFPMTWNGTAFVWSTNATQCGAYRLTARYQGPGQSGTNWTWYSSEGRRDHAIVISPRKVLQQTMYELNTLTVKASNNTESGRSTFDDLIDPQHGTNVNTFNEFSIEYLNKIQANCLWFQPIHPAGYDRSEDDPATPGTRYNPGSPYATRDYFAVNPAFGRADGTERRRRWRSSPTLFPIATGAPTGSAAPTMSARSTSCSTACSTTPRGTRNSARGAWTWASARTRTTRSARSSRAGIPTGRITASPATYWTTAWSNDIATAPDRGDFGKWADVAELYFGKYSAWCGTIRTTTATTSTKRTCMTSRG